MKNLLRSIYIYPILFLTLVISGCGGGGGSAAPAISQGQFIDAAVEGITYTSGAQSGVTDASGAFSYETGQSVSFSIGGIAIGTVSGTAIITPVQLVPGAVNELDITVVNIVQFLITIDDDQNPVNGIQITQAIRDAAAGLSVDFTAADFDTDANVSSVVGTLTTASSIGNRVLVNNGFAQTHLKDSLFSILSGTYTGTFSGTDSGNWTVTIATNGSVSGLGNANAGGPFSITGSVNTSGTVSASASGSAGTSVWSGTVNIATGDFSGSWNDNPDNGTFTGSKN